VAPRVTRSGAGRREFGDQHAADELVGVAVERGARLAAPRQGVAADVIAPGDDVRVRADAIVVGGADGGLEAAQPSGGGRAGAAGQGVPGRW